MTEPSTGAGGIMGNPEKRIICTDDAKVEVRRIGPNRTKVKIVEHEPIGRATPIAVVYLTDEQVRSLVVALSTDGGA